MSDSGVPAHPAIASAAAQAVPFAERIGAMDIARGFALLGIFVMNIGAFSDPASEYTVPVNPETATRAEVVWHFLTHGLFESKFYTLFSLLFGMGFIILTDRVQARRSSPTAVAARRFGFLAVLGLMHAHLLWFGDILFIYACCSVVLLLVRKCRARTLVILGASITAAGEFLILLMTLMGVIFGTGTGARPEAAPAPIAGQVDSSAAEADGATDSETGADEAPITEEPVALRGWAFIRHSFATGAGPGEAWKEAEALAYREGPYADLAAFRSVTWAFVVVFVGIGAAPRIVGIFILGAGMIRSDFFASRRRRLHVALVCVGSLVGVPVALYAAWHQIQTFPHDGSALPLRYVWLQALHGVGAILIPLAILSGAALLANRVASATQGPGGLLERALHPLACTGRMALTNYLFQTLVGTTLCYFYGFALFGTLDPFEKAMIVLVTFGFQVVLSTLWFKVFAIGPAEYVWRAFTYLRLPRFRHVSG